MTFIIAIPSYQRYKTISKYTLTFLKDNHIERNDIYIFVADKNEYDLYTENIDVSLYNKIIIGKLGIANQRNFIRHYFKENEKVLCLDDDIIRSVSLYEISFLDFVNKQFDYCIKHNIYLWGIFPIDFYLKNKETDDKLTFIIGSFYGMINSHDKIFDISAEPKEDYEMSFIHYKKYGKIRRVDWYSVKKSKSKKGGLFCFNREKMNNDAVEYLLSNYPEYIKSIYCNKDGYKEIRL
jgi:hypothetical protein